MMSVSAYDGTSITKQWLTRRAVRRPVSRDTTAPMSSSVCRLPFISASALPSRTSSTALAAEASLYGASTIGRPAMSMPCSFATASMRAFGPTRIGAMSPSFAASTAPRSELSSHGCATAVGVAAAPCRNRGASGTSREAVPWRHVLCGRRALARGFAHRCLRASCAARVSRRLAPRRRRPACCRCARSSQLLVRGLRALHALVGEQPPHERHEPLAVGRRRASSSGSVASASSGS